MFTVFLSFSSVCFSLSCSLDGQGNLTPEVYYLPTHSVLFQIFLSRTFIESSRYYLAVIFYVFLVHGLIDCFVFLLFLKSFIKTSNEFPLPSCQLLSPPKFPFRQNSDKFYFLFSFIQFYIFSFHCYLVWCSLY